MPEKLTIIVGKVLWSWQAQCFISAHHSTLSKGTGTRVRHNDAVLKPYAQIFSGEVGPDFILMEDNVRPRRVHPLHAFQESEDIRQMGCKTYLQTSTI